MDKYIRKIDIKKIIDADTIVADIGLGFQITLKNQTMRLYGVNAWETTRRGKWDNDLPEEEVQHKIKLGKEATAILEQKANSAFCCYIESKLSPKELEARKGKYGRWLVILWIKETEKSEELNWNEWLIKNDYGYSYMED